MQPQLLVGLTAETKQQLLLEKLQVQLFVASQAQLFVTLQAEMLPGHLQLMMKLKLLQKC